MVLMWAEAYWKHYTAFETDKAVDGEDELKVTSSLDGTTRL